MSSTEPLVYQITLDLFLQFTLSDRDKTNIPKTSERTSKVLSIRLIYINPFSLIVILLQCTFPNSRSNGLSEHTILPTLRKMSTEKSRETKGHRLLVPNSPVKITSSGLPPIRSIS